MRRFLCVFLICLFFLTAALGEEPGTIISSAELQSQEQIFEHLRPLLELTVAASSQQADKAFEFQKGDSMPLFFAEALVSMSARYGVEIRDISHFLTSHYALTVSELPDRKPDPSGSYTGLLLLSCTPDPTGTELAITAEVYQAPKPYDELTDADWASFVWLDTLTVITLEQAEEIEEGWRMTSLAYMPTYFSDDTDALPTAPANPDLAYFFQETYGYAAAYPAVFTDDCLEKTETGIRGSLKDQSARLEICLEEKNGRSLDELTRTVLTEHTGATLLSTELEHLQCVSFPEQDFTGMWFGVEQDGFFLWVSLVWNPAMHPDFGETVEHMMKNLMLSDDSLG